MSYDIDLMARTGGKSESIWSRNHTSNTAPMWRKAGCDLAEFHGKPAHVLAHALTTAIEAMLADPRAYEDMEPPNGWGSYGSTLAFLAAIRRACFDYPETTVEVSR